MSETEAKKVMFNEDEVVRIVNNLMIPQISALQTSVELGNRDIKHILELVNNRNRDIDSDINDLKVDLTAKMLEMKNDIQKLKEAIYGNGKQGINSEISQINKWIESRVWLERLLGGAVIVQIIGLAFLFIQNYLAR